MPKKFDHEKLRVYQSSIEFLLWLQTILERIPKRHAVYNQLDKASTSIPLNIAEGNGKFTPRDRCKYFDIARGSAFECAAALDVVVDKAILKENEIIPGKEILFNIVSMLVGLIKSNSADRICEPTSRYGNDYD
jgi:four helix bundle protein